MTIANMTQTELLQERQDASSALSLLEITCRSAAIPVAGGKTVTELIGMNQEVIAAIDTELARRTANLISFAYGTDMTGE